MKVKFINVGRENKTWAAEFKEGKDRKIEHWILRQLGKALVSNNVSFYIDEDGTGKVFAGFHTVGELEVLGGLKHE